MSDISNQFPGVTRGLAVVTGGSSGIGAATARHLAKAGFAVISAARRLPTEEDQDGIQQVHLDVTDTESVQSLAAAVAATGLPVSVLVNNAGFAVGADLIADGDVEDWRQMYDVNVLGVLRVTQALLPQLVADEGHVVVIGSTVGHVAYERGGGYSASKHAVSALAGTLRLELSGTAVRVSEIAPGMVKSDEFMVNRFRGDAERAAAVYQGVAEPLTPDDIADCVVWCTTRPRHVDVDLLVVRPVAQAAQYKVHRVEQEIPVR